MTNTTEMLRTLKGVTFASQNVRNLYPKLNDIEILLQCSNLDLLLLQDAFLNEGTPDICIEIDSYNLFRLDRDRSKCKKSGGGLVAYTSNAYDVEIVNDWCISNRDLEIMWLKLSLPHTRPTYVANVYQPPSGDHNVALELIDGRILEINMSGTADIVMMGDYNINLQGNDVSTRKLKNSMRSNLLHPLISSPTRVTNTTKSVIDHIWVSNQDFYATSGVTDNGLSDHHLVYVARKRAKIKREVSYFYGRSYRNFDSNLLYQDIRNCNWLPLYGIQDVDAAAEYLTSVLLSIFNTHAPFTKIKCKSNQAKWVTGEFLSLLDEREHISNVCSKHPTVANMARKRDVNRRIKNMKRSLK